VGRVHKERLYDLYSSPSIVRGDQIKKNEMGGACGTYGKREMCIYDFGRENCGKEPFGRPRRKWEYNIKMNL
jgi:hypothetical protein